MKWKGPRSIRAKLMLWLLVPIIILWVIQCYSAYFTGIDFANDAYDDALSDSVNAIANQLSFHNGKIVIDLSRSAKAILEFENQDNMYYQVLSPEGHLLIGDPHLPKPPEKYKTNDIGFQDGLVRKKPVRMATLHLLVPNDPSGKPVTIQVAETLSTRERLADKILLSVTLPQLSLILVAALIVWFGIARGLEPLERIQEAVANRSPRELSPLNETEAPKEILPLVKAINNLLSRLAADLSVQRRFVANAAHQLRTPLAGLQTQTELALRQTNKEDVDHALNQIQTSVQRAGRLTEQLLSLARSEPEALKQVQMAPVDLVQLARNVTKEFVPKALEKNIDLGYEGPFTPIYVNGDARSLYEMLSNLVDNAVRYTQASGQVTVRLTESPNAVLSVEDNGPGIPAHERKNVFERFYRVLGHQADGSGLGLAIVEEIAQSHQASINIECGRNNVGTSILIRFDKTSIGQQEPQAV